MEKIVDKNRTADCSADLVVCYIFNIYELVTIAIG